MARMATMAALLAPIAFSPTAARAETPANQRVTVDATVGAPTTGATGSIGVEDFIFGMGSSAKRKAGKLRKDVGVMMAEGKCADAKAAALKGGDFQLAREVVELCTPAEAPKP